MDIQGKRSNISQLLSGILLSTKLVILLAVIALPGCQSAQIAKSIFSHLTGSQENVGYYKIGKPYRVGGKWYYPKEQPGYSEVGIASWYGRDFQGKPTANGEVFDRHKLTAAHRTLPLPSVVRVTNIENGRSLLVRVNDRGPYAHDRILDVSEQAAKELGFHGNGTSRVRVSFDDAATAAMLQRENKQFVRGKMPERTTVGTVQLASASPQAATAGWREARQPYPLPDKNLYIQTGVYASYDNARSAAQRLTKLGKIRLQEVAFPERVLYRVRLGPLPDEQKADAVLLRVEEKGFHDAIIVQD